MTPAARARRSIEHAGCGGFTASSSQTKVHRILAEAAASSSMKLSITKQLGAWLTERM